MRTGRVNPSPPLAFRCAAEMITVPILPGTGRGTSEAGGGGVPRGTSYVEAPLRQRSALPPPGAGEDKGRGRRSLASPLFPNWKPVLSKPDRKSTRLNSSHVRISYAVFCLKKKRKKHYRRVYNSSHTNRR